MMNAILSRAAIVVAGLSLGLSACATDRGAPALGSQPVATETISYEVGPCFGFCPVYKASISPNGNVTFEGIRHTATLGRRSVKLDAAKYRAFAQELLSFRPASGATAVTDCETRISDQQHYRIVWTAPDGVMTTLEHDKGCRSARNDALNTILQAAPEQLHIDDFARQLTRPDVSRG